jgi:hypothetical protein
MSDTGFFLVQVQEPYATRHHRLYQSHLDGFREIFRLAYVFHPLLRGIYPANAAEDRANAAYIWIDRPKNHAVGAGQTNLSFLP